MILALVQCYGYRRYCDDLHQPQGAVGEVNWGGGSRKQLSKILPDVSVDSEPESYNMYIIINISY